MNSTRRSLWLAILPGIEGPDESAPSRLTIRCAGSGGLTGLAQGASRSGITSAAAHTDFIFAIVGEGSARSVRSRRPRAPGLLVGHDPSRTGT